MKNLSDIARVYYAHTINNFALSIINVYIPIYLLSLGYSLERVVIYFTIAAIFGLLMGLVVYVGLMQRLGVIRTFKLYYPLQILYLIFLFLLAKFDYPPELVAMMYGAANYAYWMPLNQLFLNHSPGEEMGSNLSKFYAYPKIFGIIGPVVGAILVPFVGFWPVFILAICGVFLSYIPLRKVNDTAIKIKLNLSDGWNRVKRNKSLFTFEIFDNVIEESEWFWTIYVFIIIGSLSTPGIVGALEAFGAAIFALIIGKVSNKKSKKLIPIASIGLVIIFLARLFIQNEFVAYSITILASFTMTMFLVTYFSTIYKTIKGEGAEEFLVIREIPTVLGRLVVFAGIILFINNLNYFFIVPAFFTLMLLVLYYRKRYLLAD